MKTNQKIGELSRYRMPLEVSLKAYEDLHNGQIRFQDFPDLVLTPEKPNSARTVVPVNYSNKKVGDLYVIVFLQGDGTGDSNTYKLDDLIIPKDLKYKEKPERVIPRAKTGVICEGFFPLFSADKCYLDMFAASLDELIVSDTLTVKKGWTLGQNKSEYTRIINSHQKISPQVYYTTGTKDNKRFGDPHSIYYGIDSDAIQVAGFLAIKDENSPLLNITKDWILPK